MSDGRPKVAIPAWQRAVQPRPTASEDPVYSQAEKSETQPPDEAEQPPKSNEESEPVPSDANSPTAASIAEPAQPGTAAFDTTDFESFKQQQQQSDRQEPAQQSAQGAPPIITYPEFLVEAHKPPPLITPSRIIDALYAAAGITALVYGASRWMINPMMESLSKARHDFLSHSQNKVDEFNERLSKIVSRIPEGRRDTEVLDQDSEDAESETSDPTELYHRDMGTQTSPLPSRRASIPDMSIQANKDPVTYQTEALGIMREHVKDITERTEQVAEANKDRQESVNKLRHYLDGMIYGSAGAMWQHSDDAIAMKADGATKEDPIEELKKEIRGVKGVLLSSKRFPSVNRVNPVPA